MMGTGIRTAGLAIATALGLGLAPGTAHAGPYSPSPAEARGTLYGDPAAAARFWRHQEYDDDCVPMAVADVVGQLTGDQPTEEAIVAVAHSSPSTVHKGPMYTKPTKNRPAQGTSFADEPALLAHYGIHAVNSYMNDGPKGGAPTGMDVLEQALAKGRKVIVAVNAELIWGRPVQTKTRSGAPDANHAVVVTGIDIAAGTVHLNDSGSVTGRDEQVPIDVFARSWASSGDQMTVTD
ncbi:hypothetical protein A5791_05850 [Mycobacterium sp. 852002-51163_SCH5372311]|uniref:C39 family peptidase n=1 Tax=Mycobacterium sp. 852002-51163_SCH5372311 TaxID=1834097 RepID=UPI000801DD1B|nr:C39 family peptidase [Mycobacterium sp. 852002-51163_SCH5372311]OBF81171.1 hypothetical protein A5791_05850 [Mycobacterium sp. 852002-51163_SCH5372311]